MIRILALLIFTSCGQVYNSNYWDESIYTSPVTNNGSDFYYAYTVISDNCITCHTTNEHAFWATLTTSSDWVNSNLVTPGDFENSEIIQRLINYNGDMPENGTALTEQDITYLRTWIEGL